MKQTLMLTEHIFRLLCRHHQLLFNFEIMIKLVARLIVTSAMDLSLSCGPSINSVTSWIAFICTYATFHLSPTAVKQLRAFYLLLLKLT